MEQGREREGGRREIDRVCVAVCAVTVDMELANEAVCLGRTRQSQEHPTPDHISSHTMVVLADVTVGVWVRVCARVGDGEKTVKRPCFSKRIN